MITVRQPSELAASGRPVSLAIGVFDGVHRGHQRILEDLRHHAQSLGALAVAVTFDPHPTAIVAPDRTPPLIQTLRHRLDSLARFGLDATWLIAFDPDFSRLTGEAFIVRLVRDFSRLASIHVGESFHFGYQRSGHPALLRELGDRLGFTTHALPAAQHEAQAISSTRIRQAICAGNLADAQAMLGRPHTLAGTVIAGDRRGRQLGFPTANLQVDGLALPPLGVYAAQARWTGHTAQAVVNIGRRPTIRPASPAVGVEAHLLDTQTDLYGADLELTVIARLRDERAFPSLDALQQQIRHDVAAARAALAPKSP